MHYFTLIVFLLILSPLSAQVSLIAGQTVTVDFESTLSGVYEGPFTAAGVATNPTAGQLDADAFAFTGFEPTALARGSSGAGVTAGGVYAFTANGSTALGFQPDADNFTPGTVTITAVNDGPTTIGGVDFSAVVCVNSDTPNSSAYSVSYSLDGSTFTPVGGTVATPTSAFPFAFFACSSTGNQSVGNLNIPPGGNFFLRFSGDDVGSVVGARDEIAFDDIVFTPTAVALPVQLTHFTATGEANRVRLDWQTAKEVDNDYFTLARSVDGQTFETIGMVSGNGTTTTGSDYRFVDTDPATGINYYRLTQIDYDGRRETFAVRSVRVAASADFSVSPNPVSGTATVRLPATDQGAELRLLDARGRLVYRWVVTAQAAEIDLTALPGGVYHLWLRAGAELHTQRIAKQ